MMTQKTANKTIALGATVRGDNGPGTVIRVNGPETARTYGVRWNDGTRSAVSGDVLEILFANSPEPAEKEAKEAIEE